MVKVRCTRRDARPNTPGSSRARASTSAPCRVATAYSASSWATCGRRPARRRAEVNASSSARVALRAALLGFMAYMTYDLTNLATLRDWPLGLSLLDMIWGALLSAVSASLGWRITRRTPP